MWTKYLREWNSHLTFNLIEPFLEIKDNIFVGCTTMTPAVTHKGHTFQDDDVQKKSNLLFC